MLKTVTRIRNEIQISSLKTEMTADERFEVEQTIDEFDEYVRDAETHVERAKILRDRAKSTAKLVSILVKYLQAFSINN